MSLNIILRRFYIKRFKEKNKFFIGKVCYYLKLKKNYANF